MKFNFNLQLISLIWNRHIFNFMKLEICKSFFAIGWNLKFYTIFYSYEILELHTEIIKANDEMEAQDPVIHSIKRKIKSLQAKEKEQAVVLGKNLDQIREIESQIVHSPQRIKKELKSMSKHVQMEQIEVAKQQLVYRDDCKKLNAYIQLQQMVNDRIEEMKDTERAMKEYKEEKVVVDGLKNERRSVLRRMDEMKGNEQMMKNKLADKKEKYEALKIEKESKLDAVNKLFRQIEKKQDLRMKENLEKQKQIIECDQKIKSFEEEREKLIKYHDSNIREIVDKYKKVSLAVHEYHNEMRQDMDKWWFENVKSDLFNIFNPISEDAT